MPLKIPSTKTIFQWMIFIGVIAVVIRVYLPGHSKYHDLLRKEEELDQKIQELSSQIEEMREEKNLLENDVLYLEKIVRENLGRVEPGETIYKVVNTPSPGYEILDADEEALSQREEQ